MTGRWRSGVQKSRWRRMERVSCVGRSHGVMSFIGFPFSHQLSIAWLLNYDGPDWSLAKFLCSISSIYKHEDSEVEVKSSRDKKISNNRSFIMKKLISLLLPFPQNKHTGGEGDDDINLVVSSNHYYVIDPWEA